MTMRQRVLKKMYVVIMWVAKMLPKSKAMLVNKNSIEPNDSLYNLPIIASNGVAIDLKQFVGKKILLVNTASYCGFTAQYAELQKLYELYNHHLLIIAFPSNDFKQQEPDAMETIEQFCTLHYGITFIIAQKASVKKGVQQHQVYQWLSNASKNGWCNQQPTWNFCKYIVNEKGVLTHFFAPTVSPLDNCVRKALD